MSMSLSPTSFISSASSRHVGRGRWLSGLSPQAISKGRARLGESRRDFGKRVGVNDEAVRRWELGINIPKPIQQSALLDVLSRGSGRSGRPWDSTELKSNPRGRRETTKSGTGNGSGTTGRAESPGSPGTRPQARAQLPAGRRSTSRKLSSAEWVVAVQATGVIVSAYIKEAMSADSTVEDVAAVSGAVLDQLCAVR